MPEPENKTYDNDMNAIETRNDNIAVYSEIDIQINESRKQMYKFLPFSVAFGILWTFTIDHSKSYLTIDLYTVFILLLAMLSIAALYYFIKWLRLKYFNNIEHKIYNIYYRNNINSRKINPRIILMVIAAALIAVGFIIVIISESSIINDSLSRGIVTSVVFVFFDVPAVILIILFLGLTFRDMARKSFINKKMENLEDGSNDMSLGVPLSKVPNHRSPYLPELIMAVTMLIILAPFYAFFTQEYRLGLVAILFFVGVVRFIMTKNKEISVKYFAVAAFLILSNVMLI